MVVCSYTYIALLYHDLCWSILYWICRSYQICFHSYKKSTRNRSVTITIILIGPHHIFAQRTSCRNPWNCTHFRRLIRIFTQTGRQYNYPHIYIYIWMESRDLSPGEKRIFYDAINLKTFRLNQKLNYTPSVPKTFPVSLDRVQKEHCQIYLNENYSYGKKKYSFILWAQF